MSDQVTPQWETRLRDDVERLQTLASSQGADTVVVPDRRDVEALARLVRDVPELLAWLEKSKTDLERLTGQRDAVLGLIGQEYADAAADVQAGGPADQLDGLSVPVHDLLIAVGMLAPDKKTAPAAVDERCRALVAAILCDFQARKMVVCEHTQVIDYGEAAATVLAALAEVDAPVGSETAAESVTPERLAEIIWTARKRALGDNDDDNPFAEASARIRRQYTKEAAQVLALLRREVADNG